MANLTTSLIFRLPAPILRRMSGKRAIVIRGKKLDAACQLLLSQADENPLGNETSEPVALRKAIKENAPDLGIKPPQKVTREEHSFQNRDKTSIPVREYRPKKWHEEGNSLLYIHGGGWVVCDLDTHDAVCAYIAAKLNIRIFSVDYRLAPEHPFPTPLHDCIDAWNWLLEQQGCAANTTAIGGDSAGANLAIAVCQSQIADDKPLPCMQLLIYPGVDAAMKSQSCKDYGKGFYLTASSLRWFWNCYLPEKEHKTDPLASPILASDLSKLPPTQVITAGFDPLLDEGLAFAKKVRDTGVKCHYREYPNLIHGFVNFMVAPAARTAVNDFLAKTATFLPRP